MANVYKQQLEEQQKKQQEVRLAGRKKKLIIIAACTAFVLVALIVSFALIPLKPYNSFTDNGFVQPHHVQVSKGGLAAESWGLGNGNDALYNNAIKNFKASRFSILRGILEGKLNGGVMIDVEYEDEDDPSLVTNPVKRQDINDLLSRGSAENFVLLFWYTSPQTLSAKGYSITYNRIAFMITNEGNKITKNQIYFYNTAELGDEDYITYTTHIHGNFEKLYNYVSQNSLVD